MPVRFLVFGIISVLLAALSWRTLFHVHSHGFYRFFSWECIIWLAISNYSSWVHDPFSIRQVFSWGFLFYALYLVIAGVLQLKKTGKSTTARDDKTLFRFEETSELIEKGIYRHIRHPLYSSLLFLTWGIFLKNPTVLLAVTALLSTGFLILTALADEKECKQVFGHAYTQYMKRSKMFIPFIL
ncbi:MAG: methyltransferase [Bacteroidota bacterium]